LTTGSRLIDLNSASIDELDLLPGVDREVAARLVAGLEACVGPGTALALGLWPGRAAAER